MPSDRQTPTVTCRPAAFQETNRVLISVLQNKKETDDTRREAAFALGAIGDSSAVAALRSNLGSADYYLAGICKDALDRIETSH